MLLGYRSEAERRGDSSGYHGRNLMIQVFWCMTLQHFESGSRSFAAT